MMKKLLRQQYRDQLASTSALASFTVPTEGWVRLVRKALGMTLRQLGHRMGVSTSAVARLERMEPEGRVTLAQLEKAAAALDCRVVYALVPDGPVEETLARQAERKARARVEKVSVNMALEKQQLTPQQIADRIAESSQRYLDNPPRDFWDDDPES
ncbi:MAG: mobile mystery protein A [Pseudomonadota bacterium]